MKALVKTQKGVGFLEIKDMPEPRPESGRGAYRDKGGGHLRQRHPRKARRISLLASGHTRPRIFRRHRGTRPRL